MSLFHPPPNFPPHLAPFWPLIWVQVLMLRAAMRAAYGKGVQYRWSVTVCGRVFPVSVDWIPGQKSEREWLKPAAHPNARLAAALDGSLFTPEYATRAPLSLGLSRKSNRIAIARARAGVRGHELSARTALAAAQLPLIPNPFSPRRRGLPLPET